MAEDRVSTSIAFDTPGTGVWIVVRLERGRGSVRVAERDMSRAIIDKIGECMRRPNRPLRPDRHAWVTVTWYASEGDRTDKFPQIQQAILRSLAKLGIDAEHAHITPQVVPVGQLAQTYYRYPVPGRVPRFGPRIEFDLIQPRIDRSVRRTGVITAEGVPGAKRESFGYQVPGWQDLLHCPVDHGASIPATEIYAIWSRAWSGPAARTFAPVHAELVASRRCPACPTDALEEAATMRAPNGQERATGRCPCCNACWLTETPLANSGSGCESEVQS
jgi:hypothetical protein